MNSLLKTLRNTISTLLPHHCPLCERQSETYVCQRCIDLLEPLHSGCDVCSEPLPTNSISLCPNCQQQSPFFDKSCCAFIYNRDFSDMLARFKEGGDRNMGRILTNLLAQQLEQQQRASTIEALVPIPMHHSRYWTRSFNHSERIAAQLSKRLKRPLAPLLKKEKRSEQQKKLNRKERELNLASSYRLTKPNFAYSRLAIIDDVITTGATANLMSKLLKENGATYVEVWALARTPMHH